MKLKILSILLLCCQLNVLFGQGDEPTATHYYLGVNVNPTVNFGSIKEQSPGNNNFITQNDDISIVNQRAYYKDLGMNFTIIAKKFMLETGGITRVKGYSRRIEFEDNGVIGSFDYEIKFNFFELPLTASYLLVNNPKFSLWWGGGVNLAYLKSYGETITENDVGNSGNGFGNQGFSYNVEVSGDSLYNYYKRFSIIPKIQMSFMFKPADRVKLYVAPNFNFLPTYIEGQNQKEFVHTYLYNVGVAFGFMFALNK